MVPSAKLDSPAALNCIKSILPIHQKVQNLSAPAAQFVPMLKYFRFRFWIILPGKYIIAFPIILFEIGQLHCLKPSVLCNDIRRYHFNCSLLLHTWLQKLCLTFHRWNLRNCIQVQKHFDEISFDGVCDLSIQKQKIWIGSPRLLLARRLFLAWSAP